MLGARRGLAVLASTAGLVLGACSLGGQAATPASTTTSTTTTTTVPDRPDTIRIGLAVNGDAPTAEFDAQIEAILEEAAISTAAETGISIDLRPVSITTPGQAEGAMLSLINDGVNVVITGCDDATVPAVVEAATANELLAVTGCVSLPRPDIDRLSSEINSDLFIDLSALRDNARAIANHADAEGFSSLAVVGSTLVPDVERVCVDLQDELAPEVNVEGEPEATGDVVDVEGEQLPDEDEDEDEDDGPDCGRIYNDRDCCDQDEICRNAWDRLNEISINDIEVGISPPLAPLAEDDVEIEEQRERLREAPFRDFKNRFGSVVASGTIDDYKDGDVLIRTEDGGSVPVPFEELGYDERCFVSAWWGIPTECLIRPGQVASRDWTKTTFTWKASSVCHKSLFFEDVQLERYGHSAGPVLQPLISGAHFFASVGLLPYSAGVYPATECHYVLGYYRPGECLSLIHI